MFIKDFFINIINYIKRYLIHFPFEQASIYNGKILKKYNFSTKKSNNLCIFSHYDKDYMVDDYVVNYIKSISEQNFDIVFISTAENLNIKEIKKISYYCRDVIVKENIGYDFGAWATGIAYMNKEVNKYRTLLLCNDSVYAPLFPLNEMFDRMNNRYDFWGITDSLEVHHHLQSYFMVFDKKVFTALLFKNIWNTYKVYKIKRNIILNYEIGLSQKLLKNGFSMGAYCSYSELNLSRVRNSSHYKWKELIEKFRCPMIKVELLRDNPKNIDIVKWEEIMEHNTVYNINLIKLHLNRVKH